MEKTLTDLYPNGMSMYELADKTGGTCAQSREYQADKILYTIECKIGGMTHRLQLHMPYNLPAVERNKAQAECVLQLYIFIKNDN